MTAFEMAVQALKIEPKTWLVTGCAGFIGSNLVEKLLCMGQNVVGVDNFLTGFQHNLDDIQSCVTKEQWSRFHFFEGDLTDLDTCHKVVKGVDIVLHQAARGSVPRSIDDPLATHKHNVDAFINILWAVKQAGVSRFVYASSSSVYGDHPGLPKVEDIVGTPLSPYAVTKKIDELYGDVFAKTYGLSVLGIRYFNVFGRRQNPDGAYSAVIPRWISKLVNNEQIEIFGDGETSRDFCYIENVLQANILAGVSTKLELGQHEVINCACGGRTTLTDLFLGIKNLLVDRKKVSETVTATYRDFRAGDIMHSNANIDKAMNLIGYQPTHMIEDGLKDTIDWYVENLTQSEPPGLQA